MILSVLFVYVWIELDSMGFLQAKLSATNWSFDRRCNLTQPLEEKKISYHKTEQMEILSSMHFQVYSPFSFFGNSAIMLKISIQ